MDAIKNKDRNICIAAIVLTVLAQAAEKIIGVAVTPSPKLAILLAMLFTLITAGVFFAVYKTKDPFMGLLASMFAYKMLPPTFAMIGTQSLDGAMLYFVVDKAAAVLFAVLIYKFYSMQERPRAIRSIPLLVLMVIIPFFNEIVTTGGTYLLAKTGGNMVLPYLFSYACYAAASLVVLAVGYIAGYDSLRFVTYFEFAAFGVNTFRQIGKIAYLGIVHEHISKSIYGWILVYAALTVIFAVTLALKKKKTA